MTKGHGLFWPEEPALLPFLKRYFNAIKKLTVSLLAFLFFITPLGPAFAQEEGSPAIDQPAASVPAPPIEPAADLSDILDTLQNMPSQAPAPKILDPTLPGSDIQIGEPLVPESPDILSPLDPAAEPSPEAPLTEEAKPLPKEEEPPMALLSEPNPDIDIVSGKDKTKTILPEADSTGAVIYAYPLPTPPGRNGLEPNLSLVYNSQKQNENSIAGYGWEISGIPYIERISKNGVDILYRHLLVSSSVSGELLASSTATSTGITTFIPRTETGDFTSYTYASTTGIFIATDKRGTTYTYGSSTSFRLDDPNDSSKIFRWMISEIRDKNNNYIKFEYFKNQGQIYPQKITYTGNGSTDGSLTVHFNLEANNYSVKSYKTRFLTTTASRIQSIVAKVNNATTTIYALAYTTGQNGQRQMLTSVTKSGVSETGATATLPATSFTYQTNSLGSGDWQSTSVSPPTFIYQCSWGGPNQYAGGVLWGTGVDMGDFNGDSISDVAIAYEVPGCANPKKTYLGPNFAADDQFILPVNLSSSSNDFNSYFINDLNGDGLGDEVGASPWLNTGSGFVIATTTYGNDYNPADTFNRPRITDLNGDGLSDYYKLTDLMYRNNGSGFALDSEFGYSPSQGTYVYYGDLNGDGLLDYLGSTHEAAGPDDPEVFFAYSSLNKGNGDFESVGEYIPPIALDELYSNGTPSSTRKYTLADINGDGLADIVGPTTWVNKGNGWATTTLPFAITTADPREYKVMDYNADGMPDWVKKDGALQLSQKPVPDILKKITYPAGGSTSITYDSSYNAASTTLPYVMQVGKTIATFDNSAITATTTLQYINGKHFFSTSTPFATSTPLERRFAGFGQINQTDSASNTIKTFYHQGDATNSCQGEYQDSFWKIGRAYRTESYGSSNNLFFKTISKWDTATSSATSTAVFLKLAEYMEQTYDGTANHKDKVVSFAYSTTTGDVIEKIEWGQVTGSDDGTYTDTGTDKYTTNFTYATSSTTTVMSLLSSASTLDQNSNKVKETKNYYDSLTFGRADKGNLTKQEFWKATSTYVDIEKTYNTYGLVATQKDPRDKTTTYTYDSQNLYPATVSNPVSHVTQYVYDYSSGKVATTTDPNGNIFVKVYDGLDRLLSFKQPSTTATSTLETRASYVYTDASGAVSLQKTDHLNSATSTETYVYFDGLNRKKQERTEAEGSNYAVKDYVYNNLGLLEKESLPYFSSGTASTTATSTAALFVRYTYDPLRRITVVDNAIGVTETDYLNWQSLVTDPNGNVKKYYNDAYGNLARVDEMINGTGEPPIELYRTPLFSDSGLVSYYRMEGSSNDSKGSNDGTDTSMSYAGQHGKFGQGAGFNGTGYITVGSPSSLNVGQISVAFWLQAGSLSADSVPISKWWSDQSSWVMSIDGSGSSGYHDKIRFSVAINEEAPSWNYSATSNDALSTSTWYHIVGTYDGSSVKLYVNGQIQNASTTVSGTLRTSSANLQIGAWGNSNRLPDGSKVDDAAIFSRALTAQEVSDLYSGYEENSAVYSSLYEYDGDRNLTKITDAHGNIRNFTYDGLGRRLTAQDLHHPSDATYGSYTYTYDDSGNLTQQVDPKSQTINYTYDDINRQLTEDYAGSAGTEVAFVYDSCTQGKGRLCTASSSALSISNAYSALGQLITSTSTINGTAYPTAYTYDRLGNQATITNPDSSSVKYNYNSAGQVETVQRKESTDSSYQDLVLDLDYGPHGKITYQQNANCTETTNTYNASELYRLTRKVTTTCYQEESLMMSEPPPFEQSEEKEFQEEEIIPAPFVPATPTTSPTSTPENISTSTLVSYGGQRQGVFSKIYAALTRTISKITGFIAEQFTFKTAFAGAEELYGTSFYNDASLVSYWRFEGNSNDSKGSNNGSDTNISYNSSYGKFGQGALVGSAGKISLGNPADLRLDEFTINFWLVAKPTATTSPKIVWARNPNTDTVPEFGFGWAWDWSDNSQFRVVVDNNGGVGEQLQVGSLTYSSFNDGDMVTVVGDWPTVTVYINGADMGSTSSFTQHFTNNYNSPTQAIGANGAHAYSASGMKIDDLSVFSRVLSEAEIEELYDSIPDPLAIQDINYNYDSVGNITSIINQSANNASSTALYSYDDLNRLTNASTTVASTTPFKYSYTYDMLGNILTRVENSTTTTYTYATNTPAYLNPHAVATTTVSSSTSFTYDNNGNLTATKVGTSTTASYTWDYNNRLSQLTSGTTSTLSFFPAAGDGSVSNQDTAWSSAHDAATGTGASYTATTMDIKVGKSGSTTFRLDRGFLPFDTSSLPDNAAITDVKLKVYVAAKLNSDNDGDDFITVVNTSQPSPTALTTADYDLAGAVSNPTEGIDTSERKDITSISTNAYLTFNLNSTGKGWASTTGYTLLGLREGHDTLNSAFTGSSGQYNAIQIRSSEYTGTASDPILEITYSTSDYASSTFAYDPTGQRVKAIVATTSTTTTYYPSKFYNTNGTTPTKHIFLPNGELIATVTGTGATTTVNWIHADHLGGTNVATDINGDTAEVIDYYPYGNTRLDEKTSHNEQRKFTGHEYDSATGLIYANARYYNTPNAKFISQDPIFLLVGDDKFSSRWKNNWRDAESGQSSNDSGSHSEERWAMQEYLSNPQHLNSYSYVINNPLKYTDPTGEWEVHFSPLIPGVNFGVGGEVGNSWIIGFASDGTFGISSSVHGGGLAGMDASLNWTIGYSNATTWSDTQGSGQYTSIGGKYIAGGGITYNFADGEYTGMDISFGPGYRGAGPQAPITFSGGAEKATPVFQGSIKPTVNAVKSGYYAVKSTVTNGYNATKNAVSGGANAVKQGASSLFKYVKSLF